MSGREGRRLHTPVNVEIVVTISSRADSVFGEGSSNVVLFPKAVLCRPCLGIVGKSMKLRGEASKNEKEIKTKVKQAGEVCGLESTNSK